jgi:hypothetical protein
VTNPLERKVAVAVAGVEQHLRTVGEAQSHLGAVTLVRDVVDQGQLAGPDLEIGPADVVDVDHDDLVWAEVGEAAAHPRRMHERGILRAHLLRDPLGVAGALTGQLAEVAVVLGPEDAVLLGRARQRDPGAGLARGCDGRQGCLFDVQRLVVVAVEVGVDDGLVVLVVAERAGAPLGLGPVLGAEVGDLAIQIAFGQGDPAG